MKTSTKIIHSIPVDELTGAISVPIYQTSTFVHSWPGVHKGYDYTRSGNPTRKALEEMAAKMEEGSMGAAFSSGMSAIDAVLKLLYKDEHIVAVDDIYGGTFRLLNDIYSHYGITASYVDTTNLLEVEKAIQPTTKMIWLETPTNPKLKISDIRALADIAHNSNCILIVDNTFASPIIQKPLELGADIVVHSATKYLGGHSDIIAGLVITKTPELGEKIKFIQNACGIGLSPFDCWLLIRGMETLDIRVRLHSENAMKIAEFLAGHKDIELVYYPGLKSHPNHDLAARQQKYYGGVVSFRLRDVNFEQAASFASATKIFKLAESLGGIKSLIAHPATMTHASMTAEKRKAGGISDELIRLSVGLEDSDDLIHDLDEALKMLHNQ
jgi:cysteine-S-conjugate beta-lyase